ncbi:MAG: HDIG domain-containing metalloprotein [Thermoguttaceae bacterium]
MPFGLRRRKRFERVASLELPPGQWERAWINLRHRDVLGRIALALLAAASLCSVIHGWDPPFRFQTGYTPGRAIVSTVKFTKDDPVATQAKQQQARAQTRYVYARDPEPLVQLRGQLRTALVELTAAPTLDKLDPKLWQDFQPPLAEGAAPPTEKEKEEQFRKFRAAFTPQESLDRAAAAIAEVFAPFEDRGLLSKLSDKNGPGNQQEIIIYPVGHPRLQRKVAISEVLIGDGTAIYDALRKDPQLSPVADRLFAWIKRGLKTMKPTLTPDDQFTKQRMDQAERDVGEVRAEYAVGQVLAKAGQPLDKDQIDLLRLEYTRAMEERPLGKMAARAVAVVALAFVALLMCGIYMRYRQRGPLASLTRLLVLLLMAVVAVALSRWAATPPDALRSELLPVLLFGMVMAIVYPRDLALLLAGTVALVVVLGIGHGLEEFIVMMGVTAAAVLNLARIRNRKKLIYVGFFAGAVAFLLRFVVGVIDDQPINGWLCWDALYNAGWAIVASLIIFGMLPFIEHFFGVLTDLSLLELGDVAHPLLQELVRRAPSTYNHSITVGSIAEAAAESIHARGLLVRVGAYFHDIGKMLKPDYFAENQGPDDNRHEALAPAMSTLVIIAHIKDGADLARQHRLPQPIIDLIAQHHGTTRVEFFYDRATEQQQADPNGGEVDESSYRYPGPKPQTKEAAVLMLADAVESASRTLVDPTPARIESLVREIAEYRLHGGQFDESGLTLRELRTIEKSMVMSLTSIYHGRIKYPEQRSA